MSPINCPTMHSTQKHMQKGIREKKGVKKGGEADYFTVLLSSCFLEAGQRKEEARHPQQMEQKKETRWRKGSLP